MTDKEKSTVEPLKYYVGEMKLIRKVNGATEREEENPVFIERSEKEKGKWVVYCTIKSGVSSWLDRLFMCKDKKFREKEAYLFDSFEDALTYFKTPLPVPAETEANAHIIGA
jgi:hypothetical protein